MKILYSALLIILFVMLLILYFINVIYLQGQNLLISPHNYISIGGGLFIIILISVIIGVITTLLVSSLIKSRPKDFDEYDL